MRVAAQGVFTQDLWEASLPVYQQIIESKFIQELTDGTLSKKYFAHYLSQDILYLKRDNEALALLSENAQNDNEKDFFFLMVKDGIGVEQVMQNEYLTYFSIQEAKEQSPVFKEYSDFLLYTVRNSPYPVALTALLPCFWLYGEMGYYVSKHQTRNNIYQKFIDTYIGEGYDLATIHFIQLVEKYGQKTSGKIKLYMKDVFIKSAKFEYQVLEETMNLFHEKNHYLPTQE